MLRKIICIISFIKRTLCIYKIKLSWWNNCTLIQHIYKWVHSRNILLLSAKLWSATLRQSFFAATQRFYFTTVQVFLFWYFFASPALTIYWFHVSHILYQMRAAVTCVAVGHSALSSSVWNCSTFLSVLKRVSTFYEIMHYALLWNSKTWCNKIDLP
jgi:hypothetical protein